ncbi:MAG: EF-hand domain-containing protein [Desulfovibrio sp.]|uniref:EF-hand domain-containing protein n=1 Tax=Desulfovibrio sp. 7SRBS1 TaxID=3378064 RepID=UPI003B417DE8
MSISSIHSSTYPGLTQEFMAKMQDAKDTPDDFATSFVGDRDKDNDGQLTWEESGLNRSRFNVADANGDGHLSALEISADMKKQNQKLGHLGYLSVQMQGSPQEILQQHFAANDEDEDGVLSRKESQLTDEQFNLLDADGDGKITSAELEESLKSSEVDISHPGPTASVSDASGPFASSGAQSKASAPEDDDEYDEYDLNKDGVVSSNELLQAYMNGDVNLSSIANTPSTQAGKNSTLVGIAMKAYQSQESMSFYTQESTVA